MFQIGKYNELKVVKEVDFGIYLDGEELGEILLPLRQVPPNTYPGDILEVFLYKDSEDRLIATTRQPYAITEEFAVLEVVDVNKTGAWLDWGLDKHLLAPFREQKQDMELGKSYLVYIFLDDESQRLAASSKLAKFLDNVPPEYEEGQEVDILISNQSDIGYTAVINNLHSGLLYKNEVFTKLSRGQKTKAYIKKIREDEKIDLILQKPGYGKIDPLSDKILRELKKSGGILNLGDKSSPEDIYSKFGVSKKDFKKAIGKLYKDKIILVEKEKIEIIDI
ncbi:MAG: GntR family transcriptional regulator [Salinivirgaceae bacterium]|nr:GntR family transcriptional regulator [Salinivirgaceae bacterium]